MTKQQPNLLLDHGDMRMIAVDLEDSATTPGAIVQLDPDHPGFRDQEYRARRNAIAAMAIDHQTGTPIPDAPYTREEHLLWRTIRDALDSAHRQYACAEYLDCIQKLDLPRDRIPQLREVSEKIEALSGFRLEPVAGLVEPRVFLESLAEGVFLCTQYIRHHSTPHYTPEPDVVHEITGRRLSSRCHRIGRAMGNGEHARPGTTHGPTCFHSSRFDLSR